MQDTVRGRQNAENRTRNTQIIEFDAFTAWTVWVSSKRLAMMCVKGEDWCGKRSGCMDAVCIGFRCGVLSSVFWNAFCSGARSKSEVNRQKYGVAFIQLWISRLIAVERLTMTVTIDSVSWW